MQVCAKTLIALIFGSAAAMLVVGTVSVVTSQPAKATPAYAQQTGKPCGYCHESPSGGGPLKSAGKKFQANGHKL